MAVLRGVKPPQPRPAKPPQDLALPSLPPGWATILGGWGDAIAGLGHVQQALRHTHGLQSGIIYYGFDPNCAEFLAAQPYVREVVHLLPKDRAEYVSIAAQASVAQGFDWLKKIGLDPVPDGIWAAHLDFTNPAGKTDICRPSGLHWPAGVREAARERLKGVPAPRYLLFPRSTESTSWAGHWPYWVSAITWLLEHTPHTYVLCGREWDQSAGLIEHERLLDLRGQCDSMAEIYALADRCEGVITTSGNLAVWAAAMEKPAVICNNERMAEWSYFERWIDGPHARIVKHEQNLVPFQSACEWLFDYTPKGEAVVHSPKEFELPPIQFCVPPGIGDFSWLYSKIRHLRELTGREVLIYSPEETPRRVNDLVPLLPDVRWGGFLHDRQGWDVTHQALPGDWPGEGFGLFLDKPVRNLSANLWLELGRPLAEFMPKLPTDYHYPLNIPIEDEERAEDLIGEHDGPLVAVYCSNRDKEQFAEWALWNAKQWADFCQQVSKLLPGASFAVLGASYDRDKSEEVIELLKRRKLNVVPVLGERLGVALSVLKRSAIGFFFPSGLGIMMHVLGRPGAMLLPGFLAGLTDSWLDPKDAKTGKFKCFPAGTPEEVLGWFTKTGRKHVGKA
jgi:hypothetical protein